MEGLSLEVLVLGLCLGNFKCGEATKAYYHQKPEVRAQVKEMKKDARQYLGDRAMYVIPAAYAIGSGRDAQIKLTKRWSCNIGKDGVGLKWRFDF